MKQMVNFNDFAKWYIGENVDDNGIIEYFEDCLDYDVRALVGTEVELEVVDGWNGYECHINGDQLTLDSIDNYFEQAFHFNGKVL